MDGGTAEAAAQGRLTSMFPYQDTVATRYPPVVVWILLMVNVLACLYQSSLPPAALEAFLFGYALVPSRCFGELRQVAPAPGWLRSSARCSRAAR